MDDIFDDPMLEVDSSPETSGWPWLEGLNDSQAEAVTTTEGPVLVLAGAGSGKTRALTTRIAHILLTEKARPFQILAVTFTNKAAKEMRERVEQMFVEPIGDWWLGTFHALAARILRNYSELLGLKSNFTIIDTDDQIRLMKQILADFNIDPKKSPPRTVLGVIDRWKDQAKTPDLVNKAEIPTDLAHGRMLEIYQAYQQRLKALNACDFGDLLLHNLSLFKLNDPKTQAPILKKYQARFRYILVDEYQDTNIAQYLWLRALSSGVQGGNICCVGDEDQSIYGWRGAEISNILNFERDYPEAKIIRLEQNYRSTGNILAAATGLIEKNQSRLGKKLWTEAPDGEKVILHGVWDNKDEARLIGEDISNLQRKDIPLNDMAILVRTGAQTRDFEERFLQIGLAYQIIGGMRFYERREIRDALAYLRVLYQEDDDLAFERIINLPKRGIGTKTLQSIHEIAREQGVSLLRAIRNVLLTGGFKPKIKATLQEFLGQLDQWRTELANGDITHIELMDLVLDGSGYRAMWEQDKTPEAPGRLENLKELSSAMAEFSSLEEFLEHVSLVMENSQNTLEPRLSIMTLHAAKGLEFDYIYLPGWEDGLFPSQRSMDELGQKGLEEERRLAYVGITRGCQRVVISHAASRLMHGQWEDQVPSRFLSELPKENIQQENQFGTFQQAPSSQRQSSSLTYNDGYTGGWMKRGHQAKRQSAHHHSSKSQRTQQSGETFKIGDQVIHDKFGLGTVKKVEGSHLMVHFSDSGKTVNLMKSFVRKRTA